MRCCPTEAYECRCCDVPSAWGLWGYEVPPSWGFWGTSLTGHQPWEMTPRETNAHLIHNRLLWPLSPLFPRTMHIKEPAPVTFPPTHTKTSTSRRRPLYNNSSPQCSTLCAGFVRVPFLCFSLCMFQCYLNNNKQTNKQNIFKVTVYPLGIHFAWSGFSINSLAHLCGTSLYFYFFYLWVWL